MNVALFETKGVAIFASVTEDRIDDGGAPIKSLLEIDEDVVEPPNETTDRSSAVTTAADDPGPT